MIAPARHSGAVKIITLMARSRGPLLGQACPAGRREPFSIDGRGMLASAHNRRMPFLPSCCVANRPWAGIGLRTALAAALTVAAAAGAAGPAETPASVPATSRPASASLATSGASAPLRPIASLDLTRYMGRWYELARYPNRFQRQCTGAATADYTLLPAGSVRVVNRCPQGDAKVDEAVGEARRVGAEGSATLQVRFAPAWLSFLPQVWGNYWVVELDPAYRLAVVSEPRREYLWVLSREPDLPEAEWTALTARLQALGFDPARLERGGAR
jgi:apolipoprotein D and lipocalin family protein